jgi:hypothetical protein
MKKSSALAHVNRIKRACLRNHHIKDFRPTLNQTIYWFRIINKEIFESKLQRPPISVSQKKEVMGQCVARWDSRIVGRKGEWNQKKIPYHNPTIKYIIEMHHKFDTWQDYIETLAHEMIHLYQMTVINDPTANHNDSFYAWKNQFKKFGLNLSR